MTGRDNPRHNLRLTASLKTRIAHAAIDNGRSVNAEILMRLEQSFAPETQSGAIEAIAAFARLSAEERKQVLAHMAEISRLLSGGIAGDD